MTKHERTLEFLIVCVELKAERIILLGIIAACNGYVKKKENAVIQRPRCTYNLKYPSAPPHSRVIKGNFSLVLEVKHTIKDLQVQGPNILTI